MRNNQPVTGREHVYPQSTLIVSTTDAQGRITHCNASFVEVSGYAYDELMGQPHNLVRHPDMPPEAFKDLWSTIGRGRPWTGIVKNRCKNGDHYWVRANVTPVMDNGKPVAYLSVRLRPTAEEIHAAEALYAQIAAERESGRHTIVLHAGRVRRVGWRDWPARVHRLDLGQRMALGLAGVVAAAAAGAAWLPGLPVLGATAASGLAVMALWLGFYHGMQRHLDDAVRFADELATCNLRTSLDLIHPNPLSPLLRSLVQIQVNLRAAISDTRNEIAGTTAATAEIARGSQDLRQRTEAQAGALQATAASMTQIAGAIQQAAATASSVARQSALTAQAAGDGGQAVQRVGTTIRAIEETSRQVAGFVQIVQDIAFQTNILALNAAVEAARAGEQGRGFAVVAGEVRTLAHRSSDAAREIRDRITASVDRVAEGSTQMVDANATIGRTVSEVHRVGELIDAITRDAAEQSHSIGRVNAAVAELDRMTQANAAMVQQTAQAVDVLRQRTQTLQRSVQLFRM